jgi:hypothetical protein
MKKFLEATKGIEVGKEHLNSFSNFKYRTLGDILQAMRPALAEKGLLIKFDVVPTTVDGWRYIKATCAIVDTEDGKVVISADGWAREPEHKTKFDDAQVTGASATYAKKMAADALFALSDDADDPDVPDKRRQDADQKTSHVDQAAPPANVTAAQAVPPARKPAPQTAAPGTVCSVCGAAVLPKVATYSKEHFNGRILCYKCQHGEKK